MSFREPLVGLSGVSTAVLVHRYGQVVTRASSESYQVVYLSNGACFESFLLPSGDWLSWSRRPCNDITRLISRMRLTVG